MESIPHGITIESYSADTQTEQRAAGENGVYSLHTWRDLHLIPVCQPIVQPPLEKTMTLDVEGMSGVADLSHGLTGYPIFKDREGSWQFWLDTDSYQESIGYYGPVGDRAYREIKEKLVSLMRSPYQTRIILDDDPSFYYIGRVWLDGKPSYQYDHAKFTLSYRLYPYKYLRNEYGGDWLWDTFRFTTDFADTRSTGSGMWNWDSFCFETDLATPKMKNVALKAGQIETFPLVFTDKPSAVFVTSMAAASAKLADQNGDAYDVVTKYTYTDWHEISDATDGVSIEFRTQDSALAMDYLDLSFWVENTDKKTRMTMGMTFRKKGESTVLGSGSCTSLLNKRNWWTIVGTTHIYKYTGHIPFRADLEPYTTYVLTLTGDTPFYPYGVEEGEGFAGNDYFDILPGEETITTSSGSWHPVLKGTFTFRVRQYAELEPDTRTNIGTVGRSVDDSGRTVTVKAKEDTVVSIDYTPAYL